MRNVSDVCTSVTKYDIDTIPMKPVICYLDVSPLLNSHIDDINQEMVENAIYIASVWCVNDNIHYVPMDEKAYGEILRVIYETNINRNTKQLPLVDELRFLDMIKKARYFCFSQIGDSTCIPMYWVDSTILAVKLN